MGNPFALKEAAYLVNLMLAPAQLVTPPKGLEIGYVPIATRQELEAPINPSK